MLDIEVKIDFDSAGGLNQLAKDIRAAEAAAAREVARKIVIPAMTVALTHSGGRAPIGRLGIRTGRTVVQLGLKTWTGKDGLTNGAVKIMGDRAHIARFHEDGTQTHGGRGTNKRKLTPGGKGDRGPLPARKMFEMVGRALRQSIETAFIAGFERNMKAKGYK